MQAVGRPRRRYGNIIKLNYNEIVYDDIEWNETTLVHVQWLALVLRSLSSTIRELDTPTKYIVPHILKYKI